ncbi:MAG: hypothetical protein ACKOWF_03490 [Chloroflexota bacterium]
MRLGNGGNAAIAVAAAFAAALAGENPAAAEAPRPAVCEPAYVDHCVPPPWVAADIDCSALYEAGIRSVRLARIGWDPHGLDDDADGYGCEGIWGW